MKKIILLLMVITSIIACDEYNPDGSYKTSYRVSATYRIIKVDSCEYINANARFAHKGNCKYCVERRKQELKELIEELKKK